MVHVDTSIANLVLGVIIPLVTALIVKDVASPGVKAGANALLAAIGGALTAVIASGGVLHWQAFAISIATVWGASMVSYLGLLKPAGVTGAISTATSNFGIGMPMDPAPMPATMPHDVTSGSAWNDIPPPVFTPAPANAGKLGDVTVWEKLTIPVALPVAPQGSSWNQKAPETPVVPQGTSWNRFVDDPASVFPKVPEASETVAEADPPIRPIPSE